MFTFLQPYWLWASVAIALPILIHLWNVKQGKIMQVGSISLMLQSDRQQAKSLRLKDLLLLIIRCLLIIVLAMLLSKPQYKKPLTVQSEKGWMLIARDEFKTAYARYHPLIDSLDKAGYQFHYFESGFNKEAFATALQNIDSSISDPEKNYWQLLNQLNQEVPEQLPVFLFTTNRLLHFKGSRPAVSMNLHWQTFDAGNSTLKFILNAYENANGKLAVSLANAKPVGTTIENIQMDPNALPSSFTYNRDSNYLTFVTGGQTKVPVNTSNVTVVIYAGKYAKDASFLKAALDAIKAFGVYKLSYKLVKNVNELPKEVDWLFWLSDENMPLSIAAKNIFHYAKGREANTASWLKMEDLTTAGAEEINISKIIQSSNETYPQKVWTDGYGNPVLTFNQNKVNTYRFYSHFNPEWNGLVWNRYFPEMLLKLLVPSNDGVTRLQDQRVMESAQYLPNNIVSGNRNKQKFMQVVLLDKLFWLLAFLLFCLERFLSFKNKKEAVNG